MNKTTKTDDNSTYFKKFGIRAMYQIYIKWKRMK